MKRLHDIDKHGTITNVLQPGQELLVQIVKEPISSKGPRLTTEITFTGRYMVLIPFGDKISVSAKIKTTEEKLRLRQLIDSIRPKNFGIIIRTSAEGKSVRDLHHELRTLLRCWEETVAKARTATAPALIFEEESRIVGMLRDVFSPTFESIHVNDKETYSQIAKYVELISPESKDIVKLYESDVPIFDHFSITRQIIVWKDSFLQVWCICHNRAYRGPSCHRRQFWQPIQGCPRPGKQCTRSESSCCRRDSQAVAPA